MYFFSDTGGIRAFDPTNPPMTREGRPYPLEHGSPTQDSKPSKRDSKRRLLPDELTQGRHYIYSLIPKSSCYILFANWSLACIIECLKMELLVFFFFGHDRPTVYSMLWRDLKRPKGKPVEIESPSIQTDAL